MQPCACALKGNSNKTYAWETKTLIIMERVIGDDVPASAC